MYLGLQSNHIIIMFWLMSQDKDCSFLILFGIFMSSIHPLGHYPFPQVHAAHFKKLPTRVPAQLISILHMTLLSRFPYCRGAWTAPNLSTSLTSFSPNRRPVTPDVYHTSLTSRESLYGRFSGVRASLVGR